MGSLHNYLRQSSCGARIGRGDKKIASVARLCWPHRDISLVYLNARTLMSCSCGLGNHTTEPRQLRRRPFSTNRLDWSENWVMLFIPCRRWHSIILSTVICSYTIYFVFGCRACLSFLLVSWFFIAFLLSVDVCVGSQVLCKPLRVNWPLPLALHRETCLRHYRNFR